MNTILMPIALVKDGDKVLLRKMDPAKSPYKELWALFGGRVEGDESITDALNKDMTARWNFSVSITERLWWDEETKVDNDNQEKRFVYLDVICSVATGAPEPVNKNETLEWVTIAELNNYDINPPTKTLLQRLGYLS
jgi:ADP-ribose pyrophosphatase YjhB (NUDIX family)